MAAFYSNTIDRFITDDSELIIGILTKNAQVAGFYQQKHSQTLSWENEINLLKKALKQIKEQYYDSKNWQVLLEYPIARREKRIDIVILIRDIIIIIEYKDGKIEYNNLDKEQVLDYCLDIRDFHFESRERSIIPILLSTNGKEILNEMANSSDHVKNILYANADNIIEILIQSIKHWSRQKNLIDVNLWNNSDYYPTPTIIEAAKALYSGKSVAEISRSHAGKKNLTKTTESVLNAIRTAKANNEKIICFVTGVPGAGKTLAGLNIAHDKEFQGNDLSLATFLSGNVPLIKVLRSALSRDALKKVRKIDPKSRKKETDRIIAFIENAHRFFDQYYSTKEKPPNNKVVIFDEAQRAWDSNQSMKKFKREASEPEMLFEIMNRHSDWSAIIALVGGGQEINTGEAGLPEWGKVILSKFSNWKVYISPQLKIGNHSTGNLSLFKESPKNLSIVENNNLHLDVSIRSYKAEELSNWVNLILTNEKDEANRIFNQKLSNYKIFITRDLEVAKQWLKINCKGSRRMGLVASSGARRLRPYGLDVKIDLEEAEWFLNSRDDIRSSYYLELPATEFRIQGLELDWVGVCWDADLKRQENDWDFNAFKGTKWQKVNKPEMKNFIINKYRVLLTRAREGMIIFIPPGDKTDHTRNPTYYDSTAEYLISCGVKAI